LQPLGARWRAGIENMMDAFSILVVMLLQRLESEAIEVANDLRDRRACFEAKS
jgi:hypothetical protein